MILKDFVISCAFMPYAMILSFFFLKQLAETTRRKVHSRCRLSHFETSWENGRINTSCEVSTELH